jgi:hypothetical protein
VDSLVQQLWSGKHSPSASGVSDNLPQLVIMMLLGDVYGRQRISTID